MEANGRVAIGVLGTGMVGRTIAAKLVEIGYPVRIGSRSGDSDAAREAAERSGAEAGSFAEAAEPAEVVVNCTAGTASLAALEAAGARNLAGKLLIDVANQLDFLGGGPSLAIANTDSLAEQIQRAHPDARVVKTLNTINCEVMVDPGRVPGDHVVFVCGDDAEAKRWTAGLLGELGWPEPRIVDLGPLRSARATEMYLPLWVALMGEVGSAHFNIELRSSGD